MTSENRIVAVTGATGFVGRHLVAELQRRGGCEIRVLSRRRAVAEKLLGPDVAVFEGDLDRPESLEGFLAPGCTVVNLAYLRQAGEAQNRACVQNLLAACKRAHVACLLHCSTADVAGRAAGDTVDETAHCLPVTAYGRAKLAIEHDVIAAAQDFDTVILRPAAVFGTGGASLNKLAADLADGSRWKNYLKSCLFGRRRLNLVHVSNVVAAILFLIGRPERFAGGVFIVSDDDDPRNNFRDVEGFLMQALGARAYPLPPVPLSAMALRALLTLLGRDNVNPHRNYDAGKLHRLGFTSPVKLDNGLAEYAAWFRSLRAKAGAAR